MKAFILRGLAAGAAGGIAAALFLRFVTETQIGYALRFEDATGIGLPAGRGGRVQPLHPALGRHGRRRRSTACCSASSSSVVVAALHHRIRGAQRVRPDRQGGGRPRSWPSRCCPGLKYPPNPPTVGDPDTISERTTAFLMLMSASVVIVVAGLAGCGTRLTRRGLVGGDRFLVSAGGAFVLMVDGGVPRLAGQPRPDRPARQRGDPGAGRRRHAPPEVLDQMLATARETDDAALRDPADTGRAARPRPRSRPGTDLVGTPGGGQHHQAGADTPTPPWSGRSGCGRSPGWRSCGR